MEDYKRKILGSIIVIIGAFSSLRTYALPLYGYVNCSIGLVWSQSLGERKKTPYRIYPSTRWWPSVFMGVDFGLSFYHTIWISMFGWFTHFYPSDKGDACHDLKFPERKRLWNGWADKGWGIKVELRIPITSEIFAGIYSKYKYIKERAWQREYIYVENIKQDTTYTYYEEEYKHWGWVQGGSIFWKIKKPSKLKNWQGKFTFEYQNIGPVAIKNKVSGKINYERWQKMSYSLNLNTPLLRDKKMRNEVKGAGIQLLFSHTSDHRKSFILLGNAKIGGGFFSTDTTFVRW
jgi:hypothetical protein